MESNKEILVFTGEWCSNCSPWKKMLDEKGVQYTAIDIDTDEGAALAQKHGVRALPTTLIFRDGYLDRKIVGVQLNSLKEMQEV